jgi:hypothetical protein
MDTPPYRDKRLSGMFILRFGPLLRAENKRLHSPGSGQIMRAKKSYNCVQKNEETVPMISDDVHPLLVRTPCSYQ